MHDSQRSKLVKIVSLPHVPDIDAEYGGHVDRQVWSIGIGAFVGAVLGGVLGRIVFGPSTGLYVGIALGAAIGAVLGGALGRR